MTAFHLKDDCWPPEFRLLVARGEEQLRFLTDHYDRVWGFGSAAWNLDQEAGTIVFTSSDGIKATGAVQIAGTYNPRDGTWLWAWDHPSILSPLRAHAERAREYGDIHDIACLTTRKFGCSEDDAWGLTAFTAHLTGSQGAYRGPTDGAHIFMTFGTLSVRQEKKPNSERSDSP